MVAVVVEGGGNDNQRLRTEERMAFAKLFERAGLGGRMPRVIPAGGREAAFKAFVRQHDSGKHTVVLLLVDSEGPVSSSPWAHVQARDGWEQPEWATKDHLHLMVECMETWFLADKGALETFYGQGFHAASLPSHAQIEAVAKRTLYDGLTAATMHSKTKGTYGKGAHSFKVLAALSPEKIKEASPHARRFFDSLRAVCC